jgi:hypothetical protein
MIKKFENFGEFEYENIRNDAGTYLEILKLLTLLQKT